MYFFTAVIILITANYQLCPERNEMYLECIAQPKVNSDLWTIFIPIYYVALTRPRQPNQTLSAIFQHIKLLKRRIIINICPTRAADRIEQGTV